MSNKMILRHLQAKGIIKANPYQLEDWLHYQKLSKEYFAKKNGTAPTPDSAAAATTAPVLDELTPIAAEPAGKKVEM